MSMPPRAPLAGTLAPVLPRAVPLLACVIAATAAGGCGESDDPAVAHVAGREIRKSAVDDTITHFRAEAKREGHDFPKEGTRQYEVARAQLLKLLVARAELEAAASREGVRVTDAEAERRLSTSAGGEAGEATDAFAVGTARAQLVE